MTSSWTEQSIQPADLPFTAQPGLKVPQPKTALKFVQLFCLTTDDLIYIAEETNQYTAQYFDTNPVDSLPKSSRLREWRDTDAEELKLLFALVVAMGLVVKPDLASYWSVDEILSTPFFGTVMIRNRFQLLFKFLHAAGNSKAKRRGTDGYDPLFRIREINIRYLHRSKSVYVPERDLSLDEATMLWKGNISYGVYNPNKPVKFGKKVYQVCESCSSYTVDWQIYTGKTEAPQEHGHTYRVVMDLLEHRLRGCGYRVYVDRYYSSPKLFSDLFGLKIAATGTVMPNRRDMPQQVKNIKLKRGEQVIYSKDFLQCMKWKDKRDIYMSTTTHNCSMVDTGRVDRKTGNTIKKPECIVRYNEMMGGVDRNDQLVKYYTFARKVMKVWKKQFFYMLNLMVLQGYILYQKYTTDTPKLSHYEFRLETIRDLITSSRSIESRPHHSQRPSSTDSEPLMRLLGRHFPSYIPQTTQKKHPQRKCVVCRDIHVRKETIYWCQPCGVALCVAPCFGDYHVKKHFACSTTTTDTESD